MLLDSDKIFFIEKGQLVESGPPKELLSNTKSQFYQMVMKSKKDSPK